MILVDTTSKLDDLGRDLGEWLGATDCRKLSIDTETTRITPARGFNPFYGPRAALIQLSWDGPSEKYDVAIPVRMRPGIRAWPELPKGNKAGPKAQRAEFRAAHKEWLVDGEVGHFTCIDWLQDLIEITPVQNVDPEVVIRILNHMTQIDAIWVMKNQKFDWLMLMADGMQMAPDAQQEDVEVQSHLTEDKPWQKGVPVSHKLQSLAERHLGRDPESSDALAEWFENMRVPQQKRDYSIAPIDILAKYGCQDTRDTIDLHYFFCVKMEDMDKESASGRQLSWLYREELKTISNLVTHTITDGCAVDQDCADKLLERYIGIRDTYTEQLHSLSGGADVEWGSPDQLAAHLFDEPPKGLGLPIPAFGHTPTGKRSTTKAVLQALDTPLTDEILHWKQADTFITSFLEPIARFNIDGFIHPDFWLTTVRTGRMSCSHPNFQNRPKDTDIRAMFVPRPGYTFLCIDYDQIEMRIAAHYTHRVVTACPELSYQTYWNGKPSRWVTSKCYEAKMHTSFNDDPEYDPHMTMVELSGLPRKRTMVGEVTAKEGNFAILYGVGLAGMGRNFGWERDKARRIKGAFRKAYPEIVHFTHYLTNMLYVRGWIANEFGRRYYVDKDKAYLGLNYLLQGCAGDLMKRALNKVYVLADQLQEEYSGPRPLYISNVVHDELVLEIRQDLLDQVFARRVAYEMTAFKKADGTDLISVPLTVGCEVSETDWGSLREYPL